MAEHPGGVPDLARTCYRLARSRGSAATSLAPPGGVRDISYAVTRRSPPPKPLATSGYPLATFQVDRSRIPKLHGALETAQHTFKRADELGNTP
jgi:hypothetical protein